MRVSDSTRLNFLLGDLQTSRDQLEKVRRQISSGKYVQTMSDDPVRAAKSIAYEKTSRELLQHQKNTDEAAAWMNETLDQISRFRDVVTSARLEALKAGTSTADEDARAASAQIISSLKTQLVNVANAQWQGQYIFSGHKSTTRPFADNGTYAGDNGHISRVIGPGESVVVNYHGQELFHGGVEDPFDVLTDLETAMANNDLGTIQNQLSRLDSVLGHVLEKEAVMGSETQRVEAAKSRLEDTEANLLKLQEENDGVDLARLVLEMQSLTTSYQAALASTAQIFQLSLFNYISR